MYLLNIYMYILNGCRGVEKGKSIVKRQFSYKFLPWLFQGNFCICVFTTF